jgi:hypothetical protein
LNKTAKLEQVAPDIVIEQLVLMRKVDGWRTLATKPIDQPIDLAWTP